MFPFSLFKLFSHQIFKQNFLKNDEIYQIYASYELSKKSTLNGRYEWGTSDENSATNVKSLAVGLNYDLWENVISRVEYLVTSVDLVNDDKTLAINLIYSF